VVRNGKLWYEMAMVRNGYGRNDLLRIARFKRSDNQSRNLNWKIISVKEWKCSGNSWLFVWWLCFGKCNFVPYEFCTITISYHNLPFRTTKLQFRTICILHHNHFVSIWYELVIVYSISIWYEMVIMYLLPYGTKWS
jgi:hypothetical protein